MSSSSEEVELRRVGKKEGGKSPLPKSVSSVAVDFDGGT